MVPAPLHVPSTPARVLANYVNGFAVSYASSGNISTLVPVIQFIALNRTYTGTQTVAMRNNPTYNIDFNTLLSIVIS